MPKAIPRHFSFIKLVVNFDKNRKILIKPGVNKVCDTINDYFSFMISCCFKNLKLNNRKLVKHYWKYKDRYVNKQLQEFAG